MQKRSVILFIAVFLSIESTSSFVSHTEPLLLDLEKCSKTYGLQFPLWAKVHNGVGFFLDGIAQSVIGKEQCKSCAVYHAVRLVDEIEQARGFPFKKYLQKNLFSENDYCSFMPLVYKENPHVPPQDIALLLRKFENNSSSLYMDYLTQRAKYKLKYLALLIALVVQTICDIEDELQDQACRYVQDIFERCIPALIDAKKIPSLAGQIGYIGLNVDVSRRMIENKNLFLGPLDRIDHNQPLVLVVGAEQKPMGHASVVVIDGSRCYWVDSNAALQNDDSAQASLDVIFTTVKMKLQGFS